MATYGILRDSTNTGSPSELIATFTAPLKILSKKPNLSSKTVTLKRRTAYTEIQRWDISAGLQPFDSVGELFINLVTNDLASSFYIRMPQIYRSSTIIDTLTPSAAQLYTAGSSTLTLNNMNTNKLPIGEFIKFANHAKVYTVKASEADGNQNHISVFPKLLSNVAVNEAVYYGSKVTMTAKYDEDTPIGLQYQDGVLVSIDSVGFIESL